MWTNDNQDAAYVDKGWIDRYNEYFTRRPDPDRILNLTPKDIIMLRGMRISTEGL